LLRDGGDTRRRNVLATPALVRTNRLGFTRQPPGGPKLLGDTDPAYCRSVFSND
jgi:hypothetical protein